MAKGAKTKNRPSHIDALAAVAGSENLESIEVKRLHIIIRANGEVMYKGFEADERVFVGGIVTVGEGQ